MKILFVASEWVPFTWPYPAVGGGGVSTLEPIIIKALQSKHTVDFLVPKDSVVDPLIEGNVIVGRFYSKAGPSKNRAVLRTEDLIALEKDYDVIFLNDGRFSPKYIKELCAFAPKIRAINHSYPEGYTDAFLVVQYHLHWILAQHGAVVAHLQQGMDQFIEKKLPAIQKNPYLIPGYGTGTFGDRFYFTDVMCTDRESLEGKLTDENVWVTIGRGSTEKKIKFAVEAWIEANVDGKLVVMVQNPGQKNSEIPEILKLAEDHGRIEVVVDASRETVFENLRRAKGCIFPSTREAKPLVPYEANCCGVPVVYTIETAGEYLSKIEGNVHVPRRVKGLYAKAIRDIHNSDHDKDWMRKQIRELYPPERVAINVLKLVDFSWSDT